MPVECPTPSAALTGLQAGLRAVGDQEFIPLLFFPVRGEQVTTRPRLRRLSRQGLAAVAAAVFATSCLVSAVEPSLRWVNSQTKDYVHTAQASMMAVPADAQFLPQQTMTDLVHPLLMQPFASTEVVFAPDPVFRPFVKYSTGGLYGFALDGHAEQQWVTGFTADTAGKCGFRLGPNPLAIPLQRAAPAWSWVAEVSYLSAADTTVRMRIGPDVHEVPLRAGLHNVFFEVRGPAAYVTAATTDDVAVCIDRVTIGGRTGPGSAPQVFPPPANALR